MIKRQATLHCKLRLLCLRPV